MSFHSVCFLCRLNVMSLVGLLLFAQAEGLTGENGTPFPLNAGSFQDDASTGSKSSFDQRIDDLKEEMTKQQRTLGSRHPTVRQLQAELRVRMKYVDQKRDEVLRRIINLEIDLSKAELKFSGNHPEIKSLRKQIVLWQQYSRQERVGSSELANLDTEIEALRIKLVMSGNRGAGHPDVKDLRNEIANLQQQRNLLGMQEECERQKLHIWRSEIDRTVAVRAKRAGLSPEQWLTEKSRAIGIDPDQYQENVLWQELALQKLATLKSPLQDKRLQGLVDTFRNSQKPDQKDQ